MSMMLFGLIERKILMIKIISGWSNPGGSSTAFINLTNAFNEYGLNATFYGPHDYHLDKCQSGKTEQFVPEKDDIIISHFMNLVVDKKLVKKHILSCHESNIFPLRNINLDNYNKIHFVSDWQQKYHSIKKRYFILPNVLDDLKQNDKPSNKIGGVIGSVDYNKQTHTSVLKALEDGCELVYIFGNVTDQLYFEKNVKDLIGDKVILYSYCDKQKMYDMVTDVYQSSIRETWGYVAGECLLTGTKYHNYGMCNFDIKNVMTKEQIVERWKKEF